MLGVMSMSSQVTIMCNGALLFLGLDKHQLVDGK